MYRVLVILASCMYRYTRYKIHDDVFLYRVQNSALERQTGRAAPPDALRSGLLVLHMAEGRGRRQSTASPEDSTRAREGR